MNQEQIIPTLAAQGESLKAAHKRIDKIEDVGQQIHRLAANTEAIAAQMKEQNQRMEKVIQSLDTRIAALEKEPAQKWKDLTKQIIALIISAVMGAIIAAFIKQGVM